MTQLAIDLFCGLGGWAQGLCTEGFDVVGFDVEKHDYGTGGYPAQLVLQDVLTLHGAQFRSASVIVASPPCQAFSYMAMPWKRGKAIAAALRGAGEFPEGYRGSRTVAELTALFDACFRIQREASEAAGRYIPLVVENVKGAQPWVGRARAHYGSYYLWGDVPALMPSTLKARKVEVYSDPRRNGGKGAHLTSAHENIARLNTESGHSRNPVNGEQKQPVWFNDDKRRAEKCGGDWFGSGADCSLMRRMSSRSSARKAASVQIAKIPFPLAVMIAQRAREGMLCA